MPDRDVAALSLAVPPAAATVTTYRPAVRVRNNGIHSASVTGYMRMYRREPPGELLATWNLGPQTLEAGAEGNVLAGGYWTPTAPEIGEERLFTAYVTCELDETESNNHLSPVTVLITAEEPPPPPTIEDHATQHEHEGGDEINVDGLPGKLAEHQDPTEHASSHEDGGEDQLSVSGLSGLLAEPQTPTTHANDRHSISFATEAALTGHATASPAHASATNLEQTGNKGAESGYCGLDSDALVPVANLPDLTQQLALGLITGITTCDANEVTDAILGEVPPSLCHLGTAAHVHVRGEAHFDDAAAYATVRLHAGDPQQSPAPIATAELHNPAAGAVFPFSIIGLASLLKLGQDFFFAGGLNVAASDPTTHASNDDHGAGSIAGVTPPATFSVWLSIEVTSGIGTDFAYILGATITHIA